MLTPINVSITDLRNNLADYLESAKTGKEIAVINEKRDEEVARLIPPQKTKTKRTREEVLRLLNEAWGAFSDLSEEDILGNSPWRGEKGKRWAEKVRNRKLFND